MDEIELLLTDEFVEFSKKVAEIHATKKQKAEDFQKVYTQFKADVAALDKSAEELKVGWETWKTEFVAGKKKVK